MPPLTIPQLAAGDSIHHELLVEDRVERTTKNGDPFWVLTFRNASGSIQSAPVWKDNAAWIEGVDRGRIVQVIGGVEVYGATGARQLKISAPIRVVPTGSERMEEFLPRVSQDPERLWEQLDKLRVALKPARLRAAVDLFFADDEFRTRFARTPGAVRGHHAQLGGLLLHVCEVATLGANMARVMRANADLVIAGALLHDIGKVEAYTVGATGFGYDPRNHLIGHVVLGAFMFTERAQTARAAGTLPLSDAQLTELQHLILSHHGTLEFGSPVPPMTLEAELLHWADETSAKGNSMTEAVADADLFASGDEISSKKAWQLDKRVWRRPFSWDEE
jgi:3'-5' exoribonuclease